MGAVREWATALCAAAVLCAGAEIIAPDEKKSKGMRIILASVMLCALILPLAHITDSGFSCGGSSDVYVPDRRLCTLFEDQTAAAAGDAVRNLAADCLKDYGVSAEEISVNMDISDDGCISIGQITVRTGSECVKSADGISEFIFSRLGLKAEVIIGEE